MWLIIICLTLLLAAPQASVAGDAANQAAVDLVKAGRLDIARASWWGVDPTDSTDALQAAIDSGVRTLVVDDVGKPWVVRPIKLASDQEIIFARGVEVVAKRGEFKGKGDSLFTAANRKNITLTGYGAALRMHRDDYAGPDYEKAEWRMVLALRSCSNVKVYGLTLAESGGDGIYLGVADNGPCRDIHIKDVICDRNYRQGISVISAENLLIEDTVFSNTGGTAPQAGIDFEPNEPDERLTNVVLRNCVSRDNKGCGYVAYVRPLKAGSAPVSIRFENCTSIGNSSSFALYSGKTLSEAVRGVVEIDKCSFTGSSGPAIYISGNPVGAMRIRFSGCSAEDAAVKKTNQSPVILEGPAGGIEFQDLLVRDPLGRKPVKRLGSADGVPAGAVTGTLIIERDGKREQTSITPESMAGP